MIKDTKLIAIDMDETLLTSKKEVPKEFVPLVKRLDSLGVVTTIASGRPLYTLKAMFPDVPLGFICDNGGIVSYKEKLIKQSLLPFRDYHRMIDFVLNQTTGIPILCGLDSAYLPDSAKDFRDYLTYFYKNIESVPDFQNLHIDADKFTVYFPDRDSRKAYDEIFRDAFSQDYTVQVSGDEWIDFMNLGVDKGSAILALGNELDISQNAMMAFGDAENDIPMLKVAKYSYIVANAVPGMKRYAAYVTASNDEGGVTKVLDDLANQLEAENGRHQ
ncbi:MAG: HAD family hydrolase [Oenococcus sp.]|uniref:HAD family hydrolase n=1 Tax=Oenococcus sp. TaxID=1979414 RepID=UPI0039E8BEFE